MGGYWTAALLAAGLLPALAVGPAHAGGKYETWKELQDDLIEKVILRQWIPMRDGV